MDTYMMKFSDRDGVQHVQYGVSMMDSFTKEGWHARVLSKDLVAQAVINQLKEIERHVGGKIRRLYSDGGSEFFDQTLKAYLVSEGIMVRVSPPHTQQLNGLAERSIRTFKDLGRTMLHHVGGKTADWLWHYAISHAVDLE